MNWISASTLTKSTMPSAYFHVNQAQRQFDREMLSSNIDGGIFYLIVSNLKLLKEVTF